MRGTRAAIYNEGSMNTQKLKLGSEEKQGKLHHTQDVVLAY